MKTKIWNNFILWFLVVFIWRLDSIRYFLFCFLLDYSLVTFNWSVLIIITRPRRSLHNRPPVGSRRELIRFSFRDGNDLRAISSVKVIIHQRQPLTTSDFFLHRGVYYYRRAHLGHTHTHTHIVRYCTHWPYIIRAEFIQQVATGAHRGMLMRVA
jgi:hypothetical protein